MMRGSVVLGHVVGIVECAGSPVEAELVAEFAVAEPVKTHVHGFGLLGLDGVVDDAGGGGVIGLDWGGGLLVAQFFEDDPNPDGFASHDVEGAEFGFGGRRHDVFDDFGDVEDGAVVGWMQDVFGQEEVAAGAAPCVGLVEVTGVAVDGEDHVAGGVGKDGLFLACEVVEELVRALKRGLGGLGLLRREGAEGGQDGTVDTAGKV
mmetsp:Transcript_14003/g.31893  ORF Transcript_14003/g.31893 Transcript_14003/m.31893 type:complete len:205 (-) Transcript_14003:3807-4421(-)